MSYSDSKVFTMSEEKKFRFWMPIDKIEKGKDKEGNDVMIVGGIASTARLDMDFQTLNATQKGFDISYLQERGIVNWNHSKAPEAVIGEPTKIEFRPEGMYVESMLYSDSELAQKVYALGKRFKKNSKTRRLGYSIEGGVIAKNPLNENDIAKARITGLALTVNPKNADSIVDIIKGDFHEYKDTDAATQAEIQDLATMDLTTPANGGAITIIDITKPDGTRVIVDNDYNLKIYKDLAATSTSGMALQPESLNSSLKNTSETKTLTKGQVYEKIIDSFGVISVQQIDKIFKSINSFIMEKNVTGAAPTFSEERFEKALEILTSEIGVEETLEKGANTVAPATTEAAPAAKAPEATEEKPIEKAAEAAPVATTPEPATTAPLEKGFDFAGLQKSLEAQSEKFGAVGILLKGMNDKLNNLTEENATLKANLDELNKSLDETPQSGGRKSTAKAIDRTFENKSGEAEGQENLEKGLSDGTVVSIKNRQSVINILDAMTFEKGLDNDFAKALTTFEAAGTMTQAIATRIKNERGITIVN